MVSPRLNASGHLKLGLFAVEALLWFCFDTKNT